MEGEQNVAASSNLGIWFRIFVPYHHARRKKKGRDGAVWACLLPVYRSDLSTPQQLSQQQEDSFALNQGCSKAFR